MSEATKKDIGKICMFYSIKKIDNFDIISERAYGLLKYIDDIPRFSLDKEKYKMSYGGWWEHCRRLTKEEIEELNK